MLIRQRVRRGAVPEVKTLWVSPLKRARSTAELYFPGKEYDLVPELQEREFGQWDGMTHAELPQRCALQGVSKFFGKSHAARR